MIFLFTLAHTFLFLMKSFIIHGHPTSTITIEQKQKFSNENITKEINVGTIIGHCLIESEITRCFKKRIIERLDNAINDNDTWQLNDYLVIEKDPDWKPSHSSSNNTDYNNINDVLSKKFEDLAESRSLRLKVTSSKTEEQARKKKDKGGFALMGGIAIAGMMAQLFMGKIVMVAGVALLLSKLALLFSVLNALKKGSGSSEHVVYSGGGGGGHESNWQRSIPRYNDEQYENRYPEEGKL